MKPHLNNKIALITGASRGLGAALSLAFAKRGAHIIAVARTVGALEELDDAIKAVGGSATLVPFDITDQAAIKRLAHAIYNRWKGLDYWLHTAIFAPPLTPACFISNADWKKSFAINATAVMHLIVNINPLLQIYSGTAIYFKDNRGGEKFFGTYGASKSAQIAVFESWQRETQKSKISVKAFTPHPMATATRALFYPGENRDKLNSPASQAEKMLQRLINIS